MNRRRLVSLVAALSACGLGTASAAADPLPPFKSPKAPALVTFGHSFVSGNGAVVIRPTWTTRAATKLGLVGNNRGISGTTSEQILRVVRAYKPRADDEVVIDAEINDVRRRGADGALQYGRDLSAMLRHLTRAGHRPRRILVLEDPRPLQWQGGLYDYPGVEDNGSDAALALYGAKTREIAAQYRGVRTLDLDIGWNPKVDVSTADTLHPNEAGVARIAAVVVTALR